MARHRSQFRATTLPRAKPPLPLPAKNHSLPLDVSRGADTADGHRAQLDVRAEVLDELARAVAPPQCGVPQARTSDGETARHRVVLAWCDQGLACWIGTVDELRRRRRADDAAGG